MSSGGYDDMPYIPLSEEEFEMLQNDLDLMLDLSTELIQDLIKNAGKNLSSIADEYNGYSSFEKKKHPPVLTRPNQSRAPQRLHERQIFLPIGRVVHRSDLQMPQCVHS